ncbi:MAG: FAD-dependent oxidoreductase [Gemmatimonadaceae bacterium]
MSSSDSTDVVVVGDGIVGLACARSLAALGASVVLLGRRRPGFASAAAAGLLAPTIESAPGPAFAFAVAARDRYRGYLDELESSSGIHVPMDLDGILRVPAHDAEVDSLKAEAGTHARWISSKEVGALEPALAASLGALLHAQDGMVDNIRLLSALEAAIDAAGVTRQTADADRLDFSGTNPVVELSNGDRLRCGHVVLAAGAWVGQLKGLPRPIPVAPLRGQMLALAVAPVRRPVYGFGGYLAPRHRDGFTVVGSTSESVGYAVGTTDAALRDFREVAASLAPRLARADELRSWSGLRPMTTDGLPILDRDPDQQALIYACGHSRNGILMAPLTADVVATLIAGREPSLSLAPFRISRFPPGELAIS